MLSKEDITNGLAEVERNKLVFFKGGIYCFNLEDLLKALVEVLGKGSVGISYKLVMEEGTTMEVKRFKDIVETKKEFEMQYAWLSSVVFQPLNWHQLPRQHLYFGNCRQPELQ